MGNIYILDQTLREGGYVNDFLFGKKVISSIINRLGNAGIDMIECGFLKTKHKGEEYSIYSSVDEIQNYIGNKKKDITYIAMLEINETINNEPILYHPKSIDGIRISFHEHEIERALDYGKGLQEKGYKVFIQPIGIPTFKESTLISLLREVDSLNPFSFYIVDTLGQMLQDDLIKMVDLINDNLNPQISLGFHTHNNMQMSFSNALILSELNMYRDLIIDSSILGIGRGAGVLHTEMIAQYLNNCKGHKYEIKELLSLIDDYIKPLNKKYRWGYDTAFYISAMNGCHPNYASYLLCQNILNVQDIYEIISNLDEHKRTLYDETYIKKILNSYLAN